MSPLPANASSQILSDRLFAHRSELKRARRQTDFGLSTTSASLNDEDPNPMQIKLETPDTRRISDIAYAETISSVSGKMGRANLTPATTRAPGIRELDERLQKLEKQNFDLKMEVFHRREREEKLHQQLKTLNGQVKMMDKLQIEHSSLMDINGKLTVELDKSNEAVDQAVQMICDLETRLETHVANLCSCSDSGYGGSSGPLAVLIPPTPQARQSTAISSDEVESRSKGTRIPKDRIPSFMSDTGSATLALREAYSGNGSTATLRRAQSFVSMFSQLTAKDAERNIDMGSPRLSVLSESSFQSIYNNKSQNAVIDKRWKEIEQVVGDNSQDDSIKRVNKWMSIGEANHTIKQLDLDTTKTSRRRSRTESVNFGKEKSKQGLHMVIASSDDVEYPDGASIGTGTPSRFRNRPGTASTAPEAKKATPSPPYNTAQRRQSVDHTRLVEEEPEERPEYIRADTNPIFYNKPDWLLPSDVQPNVSNVPDQPRLSRHKSSASAADIQPLIASQQINKSIRSNLAAKTQRLWGRLSISGTTFSNHDTQNSLNNEESKTLYNQIVIPSRTSSQEQPVPIATREYFQPSTKPIMPLSRQSLPRSSTTSDLPTNTVIHPPQISEAPSYARSTFSSSSSSRPRISIDGSVPSSTFQSIYQSTPRTNDRQTFLQPPSITSTIPIPTTSSTTSLSSTSSSINATLNSLSALTSPPKPITDPVSAYATKRPSPLCLSPSNHSRPTLDAASGTVRGRSIEPAAQYVHFLPVSSSGSNRPTRAGNRNSLSLSRVGAQAAWEGRGLNHNIMSSQAAKRRSLSVRNDAGEEI